MQLVRKARAGEVLAPGLKLRRGALVGAPFSVWNFSTDDIGAVVARLPDTSYDAPLWDLAPAWKVFLAQDPIAMSRYQRAIDGLADDGSLAHRPVLYAVPGFGFSCYIEDGQEQLFAALDFAVGRSDFRVEVFWSDSGSALRPS
jgi:hypothetical protein